MRALNFQKSLIPKFHTCSFNSPKTRFSGLKFRSALDYNTSTPIRQYKAIRLAEQADLPALEAIEDASRPRGNWNLAQIAEELDRERSTVLVKDQDGTIAGWVVTWQIPPDELHILEIAVGPDHRRQGIATLLLEAALRDPIYRKEAALSLLEVRESNIAAIALYEKAGFEIVGRRKKFYSDGEDAILMNCDLNNNSHQ